MPSWQSLHEDWKDGWIILMLKEKWQQKNPLGSSKKYLEASGIVIVDPVGWKYDPGLAIEVVNNEADDVDESELIVAQTNAPIIKRDGGVIQYGKVILGVDVKEQKTNSLNAEITRNESADNDISDDSDGVPADQEARVEENGVSNDSFLSEQEMDRLTRLNNVARTKELARLKGKIPPFPTKGRKKKHK